MLFLGKFLPGRQMFSFHLGWNSNEITCSKEPEMYNLEKTRRIYFNAVFSFFFYFIATAELHNKQIFRVYFISWSNMMIRALIELFDFLPSFLSQENKMGNFKFSPFPKIFRIFPKGVTNRLWNEHF